MTAREDELARLTAGMGEGWVCQVARFTHGQQAWRAAANKIGGDLSDVFVTAYAATPAAAVDALLAAWAAAVRPVAERVAHVALFDEANVTLPPFDGTESSGKEIVRQVVDRIMGGGK